MMTHTQSQPRKTRKYLKQTQLNKEPELEVAASTPLAPVLTKELVLSFRSLQASKVKLTKHLQKIEGFSVIVQLELKDNNWVFLIRGANPRYDSWEGTPCFYIPSVLITNQ